MRKNAIILTVIWSIFVVSTAVFAAGDNKYYSEFAFKHKLNDKFDVFFTPELRYNDDMGNCYYYHLRAGAMMHANKNLDFALAYRWIQNKVAGEWDNNNIQYIEMICIPKIKLGGFNISDMNRFERRYYQSASDRWIYHNLLKVAYPAMIGGFEFTPYISEGIYYDFDMDKANLNWATLGATKRINRHLSLGVFYRAETSRVGSSGSWITNHVLGTNVSVDF